MDSNYTVEERDGTGQLRLIRVAQNQIEISNVDRRMIPGFSSAILKKVFLPAGFPHSVSSDYLRYQVLNALQAFCSSLAGLLSSRAVLEGFGVGDPSANATNAMLLTVAQDAFGRFTTIFGAYAFGSSLVPEAKTYRFLADVLNDAAIILETLSPMLSRYPIPGLRLATLCLSSSFRALCGIAAGGSKAAIALHFATPSVGVGDVGDLSAKDSSKETVLALLGMLLGTLVVPHLTTPGLTYSALIILVLLHLSINYLGVRGLELRTLNRQRAAIAWNLYRSRNDTIAPSPAMVGRREAIFGQPDVFRDSSGQFIGRCHLGSSFSAVFLGSFPSNVLELFQNERYLLWYDPRCLQHFSIHRPLYIHIVLKDGFTLHDQLKAWTHAVELCSLAASNRTASEAIHEDNDPLSLVRTALRQSASAFSGFIEAMRLAGWNTDDIVLMTGVPRGILTRVDSGEGGSREDKKIR